MRLIVEEICEIESYNEVKEETNYCISKIGEIAHTLKIISIAKGNPYMEDKKLYEYYNNLLDKKKLEQAFGKGEDNAKELHLNLTYFFTKIQYLSFILFNSSEYTDINAEDWILRVLKDGVDNLLKISSENLDNRLFPMLNTYLSIDKYILLLEQTRAICKSAYKDLGCIQITWLNALEEFKYNCLDDAFWHLVQFFEDSDQILDIFSKLFVVEKIVALGIILLQSSSKGGSSCMLTKSLAKHFKFEAVGDNEYNFKVYRHEPYTITEEEDIRKACRSAVSSLMTSTSTYFSEKKKDLVYDFIESPIVALLLNARSKNEINSLLEFNQSLMGSTRTILNGEVGTSDWYDWFSSSDRTKSTVYKVLKNLKFRYRLSLITVNLIHSEELVADTDKLNKAELAQNKQIATHLIIYRNLRRKNIKTNYNKPFNPHIYDLHKEAITFGFDPSKELPYNKKVFNKAYDLVENVKDMHMIALNTFFKTALFNSFDAHYLFTLLEQVDKLYVSAMNTFKEEDKKEEDENNIMITIRAMKEELKRWKNNKFMPDEEYIEKKKKIYRIKWQQHKEKKKKQIIAKRAGIKKQEMLMLKAMQLKGKLKGDVTQNLELVRKIINI